MAAAVKAVENGHKLVTLSELVALPLPFEDVPLASGSIRLFAISGSERIGLAKQAQSAGDDTEANMEFVHKVIASTLSGATAEDVGKLPATVIDQLTPVAMRLAGINARLVEEAIAALKATPSGESGSA